MSRTDLVDLVLRLEDGDFDGEQSAYEALQQAINEGSSWRLQGSFGRDMMHAIESGFCMLGTERARDYWGNVIPSRYDVKEGTKGSRDYVARLHGEEWASAMERAH